MPSARAGVPGQLLVFKEPGQGFLRVPNPMEQIAPNLIIYTVILNKVQEKFGEVGNMTDLRLDF